MGTDNKNYTSFFSNIIICIMKTERRTTRPFYYIECCFFLSLTVFRKT